MADLRKVLRFVCTTLVLAKLSLVPRPRGLGTRLSQTVIGVSPSKPYSSEKFSILFLYTRLKKH